MSGQSKVVAELMRGLRHERDELKLQVYLARKEIRQEWQGLEDKFVALNRHYEPLKDAVGESADEVWDSLKLVAQEVRDGFHRIRRSL